MPQLPLDNGQIRRYILPSTKDLAENDVAWVDLKHGKILAGDMINISNPDSKVGVSFELLVARIKDWNFTELDGSKTPINIDTISRLEIDDLGYLFQQMIEAVDSNSPSFTGDQKKSS